MNSTTDMITIKRNLTRLWRDRSEKNEQLRLKVRKDMIDLLRDFFSRYPSCEVWIFGSVIRPFSFSGRSDIDIAVKGFPGSRLDLYLDLEALLPLPFDLIMMEQSNISGEIMNYGEKICGNPV